MNHSKEDLLTAISRGYFATANGQIVSPTGRQRKLHASSDGYPKFTITRATGKRGSVKAHRVQAFQKFGHRIFDESLEVRHLNGIKTDFSHSNIGLGTASENRMDMSVETRHRVASIGAKVRNSIKQFSPREGEVASTSSRPPANPGPNNNGSRHVRAAIVQRTNSRRPVNGSALDTEKASRAAESVPCQKSAARLKADKRNVIRMPLSEFRRMAERFDSRIGN